MVSRRGCSSVPMPTASPVVGGSEALVATKWPQANSQEGSGGPLADLAKERRPARRRNWSRECFWAKAVVWRLAVFASCLRSEPVVSKRSGISLDLCLAFGDERAFIAVIGAGRGVIAATDLGLPEHGPCR